VARGGLGFDQHAAIIFWLFAGMLQFGVGLLVYEGLSLWTEKVPTISLVMAYEFLSHPRWWVAVAVTVAVFFGALITHVTHWTPW